MAKTLLAISSRAVLNELRYKLNRRGAVINQYNRARRFFFHNTSEHTIKANNYYSIPLCFDIPRGFYTDSGVYWEEEKSYFQSKEESFNATFSPYNSLIATILAEEPIILRSAVSFDTEDKLEQARYMLPTMVTNPDSNNVSNGVARACAARSIPGAFCSKLDILPGDSGEIFFTSKVTPAIYFDNPITNFNPAYNSSTTPYYIAANGLTVAYRYYNATSNAFDIAPVSRARETVTSVSMARYKVIASLEEPLKQTNNNFDWRKFLVNDNLDIRLFFDPVTDIDKKTFARGIHAPNEKKRYKELYALPCLVCRDTPSVITKFLNGSIDFYVRGLDSVSAPALGTSVFNHMFYLIEGVSSRNGSEIPVLYGRALRNARGDDSLTAPLVVEDTNNNNHEELSEGQGW